MKLLALSSFLALASASPTQEQKKLKLRGSASNLEFPKPRALQDLSFDILKERALSTSCDSTNECGCEDDVCHYTEDVFAINTNLDLSNTTEKFGDPAQLRDIYFRDGSFDIGLAPNMVTGTGGILEDFTHIDMHNGGKTHTEGFIGAAFFGVGYGKSNDPADDVVCVVAHLTAFYLDANGAHSGAGFSQNDQLATHNSVDPSVCTIDIDSNIWVRLGRHNKSSKLVLGPTALAYSIIYEGGDPIGYKGCWNEPGIRTDILNKNIEIHFNRCGGSTTSTGKVAGGNGQFACLKTTNECTTERPLNPTPTPATTPATTAASSTTTTTKATTSVSTTNVGGSQTCEGMIETARAEDVSSYPRQADIESTSTCKHFYESENVTEFFGSAAPGASTDTCMETTSDKCKKVFTCTDTITFDESGLNECTVDEQFTITIEDKEAPVLSFLEQKQVFQCGGSNHGKLYVNGTDVFNKPMVSETTYTCKGVQDINDGQSSTKSSAVWPIPEGGHDNLIVSYETSSGLEFHSDGTMSGVDWSQIDYCNGGTTITTTWNVSDTCGNAAIEDQTLKLIDDIAPVFPDGTIPDDINGFAPDMFDLTCGLPINTETGLGATAADSCDTLLQRDSHTVEFCDQLLPLNHDDCLGKTSHNQGVCYRRTFVAKDECGNRNFESQVVTAEAGCSVTVANAWSGADFRTQVKIENKDGGDTEPYRAHIQITATNLGYAEGGTLVDNTRGDIRAIYFNLTLDDDMYLPEVQMKFISFVQNNQDQMSVAEANDERNFKCDENGIDKIAKDAPMKGGGKGGNGGRFYNCAIEIGKPGVSRDDISEVVFIVYHNNTDIHSSHLEGGDFGIRHTSVGRADQDEWEDSSKTNCIMGQGDCECVNPSPAANTHPCTIGENNHPAEDTVTFVLAHNIFEDGCTGNDQASTPPTTASGTLSTTAAGAYSSTTSTHSTTDASTAGNTQWNCNVADSSTEVGLTCTPEQELGCVTSN